MAFKLGKDCKLYRNTGTYATPVWDEIPNCRDLTTSLTKGESDVTRRASGGWKEVMPTLKEGTVDFEMVADSADTDFTALLNAYLNDTIVDYLCINGAVGSAGSQGLRAWMGVYTFTDEQQLTEAQKVKVQLKPTPGSGGQAPTWFVAP